MKGTICALIVDDIKHTKQLQALEASGVDTSNAILNISDSVFELVGIADSPFVDEVTKCYYDLVKGYVASNSDETLDSMAVRLYDHLVSFSCREIN